MIRIKAGCYTRGSNDQKVKADRRPEHKVCLSSFLIDKYEVTVEQYSRCVKAGVCARPQDYNPKSTMHRHCNHNRKGFEKNPINCVAHDQAQKYCKWEGGKRLPTEAEWEYAALGNDGRSFPWGNERSNLCGYAVMLCGNTGKKGCGRMSTWPVGSRPAGKSPFGVMDMAGNISEWVEDCYDPKAYEACGAKCKNPVKRCSNPAAQRVHKGGGWATPFIYLDPRARNHTSASSQIFGVGFRCAR